MMKTLRKTTTWRAGGSILAVVLLALASAVTALAAGDTPAPSQLFQSPITPPTPTVTPTPTPTATLPPVVSRARLEVVCDDGAQVGDSDTCEVWIDLDELPTGVAGVEVHLVFNPSVAQAVDSDGNPDNGVQISLYPFSSLFTGGIFVGQNLADNVSGTVDFAVSQAGGVPVTDTNGAVHIATIEFLGLEADCNEITLTSAILSDANGFSVPLDEFVGDELCITEPEECTISGTVQLQGRYDHSAALVEFCSEDGECYTVYPEPGGSPGGSFELAVDCNERYRGTASMPLYLDALTKPEWQQVDGEECVQTATLLGGDVNDDSAIDILDVAYVAYRFWGVDMSADINGDGEVNILDLTVTAANFERVGPTSWPWC